MTTINKYLPVTCSIFNKLKNEWKNDFFIIKPEQSFLTCKLKQMGIYGRKGVIAIAIAVSTLASPILLFVDGGLHIASKMGFRVLNRCHDDYYYLFNSDIFNSHFNQLQNFVQNYFPKGEIAINGNSPFVAKTNGLVKLILGTKHLKNEKTKRQFHEQFLLQLRDLVKQKKAASKDEKQAIEFVEALCEWIYTGSKLIDEMVKFIEIHLPENSIDDLLKADPKEISNVLKKFYDLLERNQEFNGIDEKTRLYDPNLLGDVPSYFYKYPIEVNGISKDVKIIRTPAITKDLTRDHGGNGVLEKAAVVEEFLGFLDSYQNQNKVHVYINLMQRKGSEGTRSKAIEDLETVYPNTFHVITLTKDFDFYSQKKSYESLNEGGAFKKEFLKVMFDSENSDYHWSPALGTDWKGQCSDIIEKIHANYFQSKKKLSQQERMDFIEIFYSEIIEAIFNKLQPDSSNFTCKTCIDRGAAALNMQYKKRCRSQKQEWTESKRKRYMAIALAPAILAMNRVMQSNRMSRLHSATQYIL